MDEHPEAVGRRRPRGGGPPPATGSRAGGTPGPRPADPARADPGRTGHPVGTVGHVAHARRRGVDHQGAGPGVRRWCRPDPHGPARAAAASARGPVRFTTTTSAAPASPRAATTARAAPPAPTTRHRWSRGSKSCPRARAASSPAPSVLSPTHDPPSSARQLTAPSRSATGVVAVHQARPRPPCGAWSPTGRRYRGHGPRRWRRPHDRAGRRIRRTPSRVPVRRTPRCAVAVTASGPRGTP